MNLADNSENTPTLYKISESGLEEFSVVESIDLYNSDNENTDEIKYYDNVLQQKT